jgi:hypothetical protein
MLGGGGSIARGIEAGNGMTPLVDHLPANVTVSRLWNQSWRVRDFVTGGAIGVTMILFDVTRLCLMGWNIDLYHFWHDGIGAEIFAIGASLTILLISLYGARPARRLT